MTLQQDEAVRLAVYGGYVDASRPPTVEEMAAALDLGVGEIRESLARLDESRHIVLTPTATS